MNENAGWPDAILWDMDGTLIDTEPYWIGAEIALCASHGASWTHEDGLTLVGNPLVTSAEVLRDRGVDLPIPAIIGALLDEVIARVTERVPWQEDARRLLLKARGRGIPCALVTMSYASLSDAFIVSAGAFDAVVTGDVVVNGKPHPEPYLTAAARLGVAIERCLAIEDSPSGIRSAHASGARTVAVRRLTPLDPLPGMSRVLSIDALSDVAIAAIMAGVTIDELGDDV
jgi:HAD superfamily hydrolase (TIGR01509 family)